MRLSAVAISRLVGPRGVFAVGALALGLLTIAAPSSAVPVSSAAWVSSAGPVSLAGPAQSHAAGTGWLRLAHLSPNTPPVDVYLYSFGNPTARVVLHHVSYGTVSPYLPAAPGTYTIAMRSAGAAPSAAPVLSTAVHVRAGEAYTVAGMGELDGLRLQVLNDRLTAPRGQAMIRVIQASMRQHRVTVQAGSHLLARGMAFATATGYLAVPPGRLSVRAAGVTERAAHAVTLRAGTIHTLVVLDVPGRLRIIDLVDAAGSRVMPSGAPATGLGGTASRPESLMTRWLMTAVAGLLVTIVGLIRYRRSRRDAIRAR